MSSLGDRGTFYSLIYVPDDLRKMADRLMRLPYATDAAAETGAVIANLEAAIDQAARLGQVWYAVERFDSGDGQGEIDIHDALMEYRSEATQP